MTDDLTPKLTAPSIADVCRARAERLQWLREKPERFVKVKRYYSTHWAQFINDWGVTVDPRNAEKNLPTAIPFSLWPIQFDWFEYVLRKWRSSEPGVIKKSRDMGVSWLAMALSCTMMLPDIGRRGINIGFGSAKEDKVDRTGDPDSLFYKGEAFLCYLPQEFRPGWDRKKHRAHMRLTYPATECAITGEAGDNVGRGGRKAIYFLDEAAHIEHPLLVDASLSATTNCQIDMSSVNGPANRFAEKITNGKFEVFDMPWRSDPRKMVDPEWEQKMRDRKGDVIFEQEYGGNLNASQEGVICPANWVSAAVDAHKKLNLTPSGARIAANDVADRGVDKNAWGYRHGFLLAHAEAWSGKDGDIYKSTEKCFMLCDEHRLRRMFYDADGLGAGVRGDARMLNKARRDAHELARLTNRSLGEYKPIEVQEFRGSGEKYNPEGYVLGPDGKPLDRTNEDFFLNYKAQSWWALRFRFQQTWRALNGLPYMADHLISIDGGIKELSRLLMEISQPVYKLNGVGKVVVDKLPDGALSPNLGDMVMMLFAPRAQPMVVSDDILARA